MGSVALHALFKTRTAKTGKQKTKEIADEAATLVGGAQGDEGCAAMESKSTEGGKRREGHNMEKVAGAIQEAEGMHPQTANMGAGLSEKGTVRGMELDDTLD